VATCDACDRLIGYPASVPPHGDLHGFDAKWKRNGVIESFKCRACGSRWTRFRAAGSWRGARPAWHLHLL
jgi:hypothetical protein